MVIDNAAALTPGPRKSKSPQLLLGVPHLYVLCPILSGARV